MVTNLHVNIFHSFPPVNLPFLTAKVSKGFNSICHWQGHGTKGELWELNVVFCCRAQIWMRCVLNMPQQRGIILLPASASPLRVHCPCFPFCPSGSPTLWEKTQVLFHKAAFHTDTLQQVLLHGAVPPQVLNFAFVFFLTSWSSHQSICPIPLVRSLWISALSSSISASALKSVWSYCQDFKRSQFWFLRDITCNQLPAGVSIADITLWSQW